MYIIDQNRQNKLINEMTQLRKDMKSYEVYYHHTYTNRMWKSFFPRASLGGLGPKLLRHEPLPDDLDELLSICLSEVVPQNAIGLGIELSVDFPRWPTVFDALQENYSRYKSSQVRLFLKHLGVEKYREYAEQFNRDLDEVDVTEKELQKLVWKSRKLKLKSYVI